MFEKAFISGGVILVLLTIFTEYGTGAVQRRLRTELSMETLPRIKDFLKEFSDLRGWDSIMTGKLQAAAEETLLIPVRGGRGKGAERGKRLRITAKAKGQEPSWSS